MHILSVVSDEVVWCGVSDGVDLCSVLLAAGLVSHIGDGYGDILLMWLWLMTH
jgi:hypothetical protein